MMLAASVFEISCGNQMDAQTNWGKKPPLGCRRCW